MDGTTQIHIASGIGKYYSHTENKSLFYRIKYMCTISYVNNTLLYSIAEMFN